MAATAKPRIDWVDYAKGICIILVVMMHSTLGVEKAAGELSSLNSFIEWARPFRMPDFFMISGLFLAARIDKPWAGYLDSKVLHFAYFYLLWMTIQFLTKGYGLYQDGGVTGLAQNYALGLIEPFGTLWFIYMLAIFFVVVKALRRVPPLAMFAAGAVLEMSHLNTGWLLIDEFAARFVYFYAGFWLASHIFAFASRVDARPMAVIFAGLVIWGFGNAFVVHHGWSQLPGVSLVLGFIGALAVVSSGVLLSKTRLAQPLRYCGQNSIVIYLAFFLFMAGARSLLLKTPLAGDLALVSLLVTAAGVVGPVLLFWATRNTWASFLFRRPEWARLSSSGAGWHSAVHGKSLQSQAR
ncbi:acyltransferase family protein [Aestuariivirga sp.]|uniref:acyltransferase family protein n=1 Tax=Aestuariivirga sp. TaxID=2650926 RepID=UPI0039E5D9E3